MIFDGDKNFGKVFVMTNDERNSIVSYMRDECGRIFCPKIYDCGGRGSNSTILSQNSIVLSKDKKFLFAVNIGSSTICSFRICKDKLCLIDVKPSGGIYPVSLAVSDNYLYVTNLGDINNESNIVAFYIKEEGSLSINNSSKTSLSLNSSTPSSLIISQYNKKLTIIEEKASKISIYNIYNAGIIKPSARSFTNYNLPFALVFINNNKIIVSEKESSSLSSYIINNDNSLDILDSSVKNYQNSATYLAAHPTKNYVYVTNNNSSTISIYKYDEKGNLYYLDSIFTTSTKIGYPADIGIDSKGDNLYVLNMKESSISVYEIKNEKLQLLQIFENTLLPKNISKGLVVI